MNVKDERGVIPNWVIIASQVAVLVLLGAVIGLWFSPRGAYGATGEYRTACADTWQDPQGNQAIDCRAHGWTVHKRFVIGPKQVVRTNIDFRSCAYEDGSGGKLPCSWNWWGNHDGNGRGLALWYDRAGVKHYVWPATPVGNQWRWVNADEDHYYDNSTGPKRWTRCATKATQYGMRVKCADGDNHTF
jgi:hypothetical protein